MQPIERKAMFRRMKADMVRESDPFEIWKRRPVYFVQCYTFKVALHILGIKPIAAHEGYATPGNHVLAAFRALPAYRDQYAKALRQQVAKAVRGARFQSRAFPE